MENGELCKVLYEIVDPRTLQSTRGFDYGTFVMLEVEADGTPKKLVQYSLQTPNRSIGEVRKLDEITL